MKKHISMLTCFLLFIAPIRAQEKTTLTMPRFRWGVETGTDLFFGEINKSAMLRENQSHYSDYDHDYYCGFVSNNHTFNFFFLGIKPEYALSKRWSVSAGARFVFNKFKMDSDKDYFLWKVDETAMSSNYVRVKNISQKNYYVGIPLQVKFFVSEKDFFVRQYFVLGTVLNFLATSTKKVAFQNVEMEKYTSTVLDQIGKPTNFHGYIYSGMGLKIGKSNHPFGCVELHLSYMLEKNGSNALADIENAFGLGLQATLHIPSFKKHQLIYTITDN